MENIQGISSGRTSPAHLVPTRVADFQSVLEEICSVKGYEVDPARPAKWPAAGRSWQTISVSHGGYLMRSTGESPSAEKRIYLVADFAGGSAGKILFESEACLGILHRASARGKELPELLRKALERQAASA